jgi:uroporphyrinogen-III synthase
MNPELLLHIQSAARIYTIGKATYQSLASKGIHAIHPHTIKNSGQLTDYIIKNESREHAILLPGAKARAFDAASRLSEANFYAENLDIYETVSASRIAPEKMQIMEQDHISPVICFASPSAVHGFISGCDEKLELLAQKSIAVAIGLTTDAACQPHFQKRCSASEPTLASLAAMAAEIYRRC